VYVPQSDPRPGPRRHRRLSRVLPLTPTLWRLVLFTTRRPPSATLFPYTTLFRSSGRLPAQQRGRDRAHGRGPQGRPVVCASQAVDRKSTRLNSNHVKISYAGFCLKKRRREAAATSPGKETSREPLPLWCRVVRRG